MMKVVLIRHGQPRYPITKQGVKLTALPETPLSELGIEQMLQLGDKLPMLDAVYTSPITRARESARLLTATYPIPTYVVNELRVDSGNLQHQADLEKLVARSREAAQFVIKSAVEHGYNTIGVVGHGTPLSALRWVLSHNEQEIPDVYSDMTNEFRPEKAVGYVYQLSEAEPFRIIGEGIVIKTEAAVKTIEGRPGTEKG